MVWPDHFPENTKIPIRLTAIHSRKIAQNDLLEAEKPFLFFHYIVSKNTYSPSPVLFASCNYKQHDRTKSFHSYHRNYFRYRKSIHMLLYSYCIVFRLLSRYLIFQMQPFFAYHNHTPHLLCNIQMRCFPYKNPENGYMDTTSRLY